MSTKTSDQLTDAVAFASGDEFIIGRGGKFMRMSFAEMLQAGYSYTWSTDTTASNPSSGTVKGDNAALASITTIRISETDSRGNNLAGVITTWDDSTSALRGRIEIFDPETQTNYGIYKITAAEVETDGNATLTVTELASGGSFTNALALSVLFVPNGDKGDTGAAGADGADPGVLLTWYSGDTDADPGSGKINANSSDLSLATLIMVDLVNRAGSSISTFIGTIDDSTSTTKGTLVLTKTTDLTQATFDVTALTVNTDFAEITVTNHSGATAFVDADAISLQFYRVGDKGNTGAGLAAVVDDTAPQLGGVLDTNSHNIEFHDGGAITDDSTNEQIVFHKTATAVNQVGVTNAATGAGPTVAAEGGDTNIDLNLSPKGTGAVNLQDALFKRPVIQDYGEKVNAIGAIGGGTCTIDLTLGNVVTATVNTSTTTFVFSNPSPSGDNCSFTLYLTNGGSQTVNWPQVTDSVTKWAGGTAPTLTSAGVDILVFTTTDGGLTWYGFAAGIAMA